MSRRLIRNGKHRGKHYDDVIEDRGYCAWLLRTERLPASLAGFVKFMKREYGGVLAIGRHKHKLYEEVLAEDAACPYG